MPKADERCARKAGHRNEHKSPYAMDNAARKVMGHEPDPFIFRDGAWVHRRTGQAA